MPLRDLKQQLDASAHEPLAVQLVGIFAREILEGRLGRGEALPGSRALAEDLGLSRHVVMSAMRELEAEGWVISRPGSGTYVSEALPAAPPRHWGRLPQVSRMPDEPAFPIPSQLRPVSSLGLGGFDVSESLPDARLAPKAQLSRGYQRALRRHGDQLLGKSEPRGNQALREQLAAHLTGHRGLKVGAEHLLVTRGWGDSVVLVAAGLLPNGGDVAVEDPGNPAAWEALRSLAGVNLHPISVDQNGLDTAALEALLARQPIRLVLVSPNHQVPTGRTLSELRRTHLLVLAMEHDFAILEDDSEFEFFGPSGPVLPLASRQCGGRVIHMGSLAQLLAPGLGMGFLAGPKGLVDRLARVRQQRNMHGDRVLEWAVADLIRDGDLERHLARVRKIYLERRAGFCAAVARELGPGFESPEGPGGLSLWIRVPPSVNPDHWTRECGTMGIKISPGRRFDFNGRDQPYVLMGFAGLQPEEATEVLRTARKALNLVLRSRLA